MLGQLGGSPDSGGTWQGPGGPHGPQFDPASDTPGTYTYTIAANGPCPAVSATLTIGIQSPPNAGTNASISVCSTQASFNMRLQLGGTPQAGGTWTDPGGQPHVSSFDPATDVSGVYTYTVSGQGICPDAVATLTVNRVQAPNAGTNGSVTLCNTSAAVHLIDHLGGTPDPGGTWTGPSGAHGGVFDPAIHPAGGYTYTVAGSPPCTSASATVTVTVNQQPNAGTNGSISVCSNAPSFNLFAQLGGSPQVGGTWTGPGGGSVSVTYTPGTSSPGTYTYTILGQPPCVSASATVTVTQVAAPNAGQNANMTVCSNDAPFQLLAQLNGTPQGGGSWTGPNGPHNSATFNPAVHPGGNYVYTVAGTTPCANATATLNITVRPAPNAGTSSSHTVCSSDGNVQLFSLLGGSPQSGGSWTGPSGNGHSGTFVPGTSPAGVYTYTVVGQSPCEPATATVTMSVSTAPVAGVGGSLVRCSNDAPFPLFAQLGGTPDTGGTWTGPNGPHPGTFTPGTSIPGPYVYTVTGEAPCANATATLTISVVAAPNAGISDDTLVCSNAGQFALLSVLDGQPGLSGTWTAPGGGTHNGMFTPGTSTPGIYTYTVEGQTPCANASATVTVAVQPMPNPGTNGAITVCSDAPAVDLFSLLGGTPATGGTWTSPGGGSHNGTYQPATQVGGTYTYTVAGTSPCPNASATVQVVRVMAPRAGTDGSITVCSTNGPFPMIDVLGGDPNGGGSWFNGALQPVGGTFTPGTTPAGVYGYVVTGNAPCSNDTAYVTVNVNQAPNAGSNSTLTVCSSDAPFALLGTLGGSPDANGTWTGPSGATHGNTFTPGTSVPGGYTYTVQGQTPCLNASAVVVVNQVQQPSAGTNGSFTRCSTDGPVDLTTILGGTPFPGGAWTGPGPLSGSIFTPGTSAPGTYTYTVAGTQPCTNATAQVTAVVNNAPDAGTSGNMTICADTPEVDLFTGLGGNPDQNGSWNDDDGTNQLSGNIFSPAGLSAGTYSFTYTVPGIGQCTSAEAQVQVTIVGTLNAGSNGVLNVCRTNTQVDLFNGLNGTPQQGGTWVDLDNTGAQTGQYFNASFVQAGTYTFQYQLIGTAGCPSSMANVTVNVTAAPNAGCNGEAVLCGNGATVNLFNYLGCAPATGGTWTRNGSTVSSNYNPVLHAPGTFIYTVPGSGPCANAQASVIVTEVDAPNAGTGGPTTVCCSGDAFNMTALLTGSPQAGTWSFNGDPHTSIFQPCVDQPGVYVYTVAGQAPCNAATASVSITVVDPANAGENTSADVCSDDPPFLMLSLLNDAQLNGTWTLPDNGTNPAGLQYQPGSSTPGEYIYTVAGDPPCPSDEAIVTIFEHTAPNAGNDVSVSFCSNGSPVDLFTVLPGSPDPTGNWFNTSMAPFNGWFDPQTMPAGPYTYVVQGGPSCENDTTLVTVNITPAPNAGESAIRAFCSNNAPFSMVLQLNGSPQLLGSWHGPLPSTAEHLGLFFPGGDTPSTPGTYVYTVPGTGGCPPATSTLEIIVNPAPFAGVNANLALCSTSGAQNLFPLLGPDAQPGGTWSGGAGMNGIFDPAIHPSGTYTYTVTGLSPCLPHSAQVTVTVNQAPSAGCNGLTTICDNASPFMLSNILNCSPVLTGSWTGPDSTHTGIFIPGQDVTGVYTYTVNGTAPCSNATAQVTVIQNTQANAGQNGVVQICSDQPPFQLFTHLTGAPDVGGSWLGPSLQPFSGTFIPGSSPPGVYTYFHNSLSPCTNDSATVTVVQSIAANAGCNSAIQLCSNSGSVALIDLLGCSPQTGGFWTFGQNGPQVGGLFDPANGQSGTYVYHVLGIPPCSDTTAQVQITVVTAPFAGTDGAIAACVDATSIILGNALGGTFTTGGTWTNMQGVGTLSNGVFNATGVPPGSYQFRYVVQGLGPCANDTSFVTVQVVNALNAGDDANISACFGELVDLFGALGGTPQAGGQWQDIDNSGALVAGAFNTSLVDPGTTWRFDHILPSSALCEGDTARVTVSVLEAPNAGCNGGPISVCSSGTPIGLSSILTCSPDGGGIWHGPLGDHSGIFDPEVDPPGIYWYVLEGIGNCPGDSASVTVEVQQAPYPGEDTSVSICSSDPPIQLFPLLGPDAGSGGSWFYVTGNVPHSGVYNPAVDQPGVYRYRLTAQLPCANADAFLTIAEPVAPYAGCNASVSLCSSSDPINLFSHLGCSPQTGGTWYDPEGEPHGSLFDPGLDQGGPYLYVIEGVEPCANDSSTLFIVLTAAQDPGTSTTINVCLAQSSVDLLQALGSQATPGGNMTDINGSGALSGYLFDPSAAGIGTWNFVYGFAANGPCPAVSSTITVVVGAGANAGADSTHTICGHYESIDLFNLLGGEPDPGGTWEDLLGTGALLPGGILNAQLLPIGTTAQFAYQIDDLGCGSVVAIVTITAAPYADPGTDSLLVLCITGGPVALFNALGGTPGSGGVWTDPANATHDGTFQPGTDIPGTYTYTMPPNEHCPALGAEVFVQVDPLPDAGVDGMILVCDTVTALPLFEELTGSPQAGGQWVAISDVGNALTNGLLNTSLLQQGTYALQYTVTSVACGSDSAILDVQVIEGVSVGAIETECQLAQRTYTVSFALIGGDPASYSITGITGSVSSGPPYIFISDPIPVSQDYEITVTDGSGCATSILTGGAPCEFQEEIFIPESFSPNDDGINDVFQIPGIEGFPENSVVIFNRWGSKVYEAAGYDNRTVFWDGTSVSALIQGKAPAGTYYYVIELGGGGGTYTGFIYLNR